MRTNALSKLSFTAAVALLAGACGPSIESNAVVDASPVDPSREVSFLEEQPPCDQKKIGDIRVKASDWPQARPEVAATVRDMGGEAVVGWQQREVVVDPGGGGGSAVPGASGAEAHRDAFYFGVVVRLTGDCPAG